MSWFNNFRRRKEAWESIPMYVDGRYIGPIRRPPQRRWLIAMQNPLPISQPHRGWLLRSRIVAYQSRETPDGIVTQEVRKALLTVILVGVSWRKATRLAVSLTRKSVWTIAISTTPPYVRVAHDQVSR